jgi:hypothetical protein
LTCNVLKKLDSYTIQSLKCGNVKKQDMPKDFIKRLGNEYSMANCHRFSWGAVSEETCPCDPDENNSPPSLHMEFMPISLLLIFPASAQLEDLFIWLYQNHPRFDPKFDCDEGHKHWSVISFYSREGECDSLRDWVGDTFIPFIWPDLLAEAFKIVEEKIMVSIAQSPNGSFDDLFIERGCYQLCDDPAKLSFNLIK